MEWGKLGAVLIGLFIVWLTYRSIRNHPEWFSKENMGKSFGTMGFLALGLIAFIALCVVILRMG